MKISVVAVVGGVILAPAGLLSGHAQAAPAHVPSTQWTSLHSKHDLPAEVLAAFVDAFGELADRGQPFRATDVVLPGEEGLPSRRFIQARSNCGEVILDFEQGGRGYSKQTVRFQLANGHWTITERSN